MDRLRSMQAFVTVVESAGFSAAARRLKVSKALISKQVRQLEEVLGVRLLHRTTRRVSTTSAGQAYYEQGKPILAELSELDASIQRSDQALQGVVRVSAPVTFAEMHLMPVVSQYSKQYPEVAIQLELTDRFINLVEERIDLAIRIGKLDDSSLVSRRVGEIRLLMCASREYLQIHSAPQTLAQLSEHQCIVDSNSPDGATWSVMSSGQAFSIQVNSRIQVNNARAARQLVLEDNGIGFLPSFAVTKHLASGRLVHVLPDYGTSPLGIYAIYPHRRHLSPKVRKLVDLLAASL